MSNRVASGNSGCGCGEGPQASGCCSARDRVLVDVGNVARVPWWVTDLVKTTAGSVPQVATRLQMKDTLGSWKARWGIGRMNYRIPPGLYAVGKPDSQAPVLVTANYKMTFDRLRRELGGHHAWIMVLDTKGINVWCAAGKGTFGTEEIINRAAQVRLPEIVSHRTLVLPQLGAPGVAAHEVQKATGFKVVYGPVRASDIPAFLAAGNKATPEMREVRFGPMDRLVLAPVEIVASLKYVGGAAVLLFLIDFARAPSASFPSLLWSTLLDLLPFLGAYVVGTALTPLLLPFVPGRAFAWKGWLLGFLLTLAFVLFPALSMTWKPALFYLLVLPALSSYLAMNFTGASTYTSLSGVAREMKTALPAQIISAGAGLVFLAITALITYFS